MISIVGLCKTYKELKNLLELFKHFKHLKIYDRFFHNPFFMHPFFWLLFFGYTSAHLHVMFHFYFQPFIFSIASVQYHKDRYPQINEYIK